MASAVGASVVAVAGPHRRRRRRRRCRHGRSPVRPDTGGAAAGGVSRRKALRQRIPSNPAGTDWRGARGQDRDGGCWSDGRVDESHGDDGREAVDPAGWEEQDSHSDLRGEKKIVRLFGGLHVAGDG